MNTEINVLCKLSSAGPAECRYRKQGCCKADLNSLCAYKGDTITTYTFELTVQLQANSKEGRPDLLNRLYDSIHGIAGIEEHSIH